MNKKAKSFFSNIRYIVSANILILIISATLNLVVPRYLDIEGYSYWQLYIFYISYVGFFHLGWLDGIYLKIGGEHYTNLDKDELGSEFKALVLFQIMIALMVSIGSLLLINDEEKKIILMLTSVTMVITNCRMFILYVFQSTNKIKEYAKLSRNDRYIYLIGIVMYLFIGGKNFYVLITLDIASKFIILMWGIFEARDIILSNQINSGQLLINIINNIKIGSNLMISNIASLLIIGVVRLLIERNWDIITFGKLSLTLNISNMLMIFINAVGIVMYPLLRRTDSDKLPNLFINIRNVFVPITMMSLLLYYVFYFIMSLWLPAYRDSLFFMGILFSLIIYEGRVSLIINTYLKTLRKEKYILFANILSLAIAILMGIISAFVFNSLIWMVLTILISLIVRCIFAEYMLAKLYNIALFKKIILELIVTIIFVSLNISFDIAKSGLIFSLVLAGYTFITFKSFKDSLSKLLNLIKL